MAKLKLYVMKIGQINLPDKGHMTPGSGVGQPISMPAYCYLIEHEKGIVLVDTGEENGGPAVASEEEYCYNQIEKIGYKPDDIDYVVMTHLHVDHAAFMNKFPNSTFIVRNEELKAAWWPEKCEKGYVYDHYRDTRDFDFIQPCDDEEYDVFGDGTEVAGISQSIQYHKLDIIMLCQNVLDIIRADKPGCTGYEISLH